MKHGIHAFEINEIEQLTEPVDFLIARVTFNLWDEFKGEEAGIVQTVSIKVRLVIPESVSLEQLHEATYRKALEQIPRVLTMCEAKTAKLLRLEVGEAHRAENYRLENWTPDLSSL